jgi:magnesium chelatase family protein
VGRIPATRTARIHSQHPGEVSLAHDDVLFLDESLEFPRNVLELLRQSTEVRGVIQSPAQMTLALPATFMLAAAKNPYLCGH